MYDNLLARVEMLENPPLKQESKEPEARGLFQVYVVDYKNDFVEDPVVVVAESLKTAKLEALRKLGYLMGGIDDYDFITHRLGDVQRKKHEKSRSLMSP